MSDQVQPNQANRGQQVRRNYGKANPAFQANRFRRNINIVMNEEMADALVTLLCENEGRLKGSDQPIPSYLFAFNSKLQNELAKNDPTFIHNDEEVAEDKIRVAV